MHETFDYAKMSVEKMDPRRHKLGRVSDSMLWANSVEIIGQFYFPVDKYE